MKALAVACSIVVIIGSASAVAAETDLIVYFHGDWGNLNLYTIPVGGGAPTQLTENAGNNLDPEWSPDGTQIVFQSDRDGSSAIYVMNADGSDQTRLTPPGVEARSPHWSPDGERVLFNGSRTIGVIRLDGTGLEDLTPPSLRAWNAKWGPQGDWIVFESDAGGDAEIYLMAADGSNVTQLTSNTVDDQHPVISPDGMMIAFNSHAPGREDFDLFVMDLDGSNVRRVTTAADHDEYASWSSDGQELVFAYGNSAIYAVRVDGTGRRRVTMPGFWTAGPSWQPTTDEQEE